ncbi:uncharacterized protein LOC129774355 [Toxorhynchites rutilus septentrionalis]|uniref:uncharacterized protein LOC129774355 n=2 Tax=Toxorhynchites rutilus septentrionalis TaxID=329112 RepID=UPI00247AB6E0|nr:uncharacterized protein LOC129774355 [Toxorhynchites rutilus septentrionalis]
MPPKEEKMLAERLVQQQGLFATRNAIEKFIENYDAERDTHQISVRLESLDRVNASFLEVQDAIERLDKSEMLEAHLEERVDFEQRFCEAKGFLLSRRSNDANQTLLNTSITANSSSYPTNFHLRLPKIDLPKFNGDFSRWLSFRDTFTSMVHSNGDIPTVAKLQYLLQSLEGEAKKPFESIDIEADNYAVSWEVLLKRHHTLLHDSAKVSQNSSVSSSSPVQQSLPSTSGRVDPSSSSSATSQVSMTVQSACPTVLLETIVLNVVDDHGNTHKARALLDSASMSNFMSQQLAKSLFNRRTKVDVSIAGIGLSTQKIRSAITATIESPFQPFSTKMEFLVLKHPSAELPTVPINTSEWNIPNVVLADPQFNVPGKIDLVIGSESFWELHTGQRISLGNNRPWLAETPFGWAVSGSTTNSISQTPNVCFLSTANDCLETVLQKFWEIETVPTCSSFSDEENYCEELYKTTTIRDPSGRYVVRLPRTEKPEVILGDSRSVAERRLFSLERRLQRDPVTRKAYHRFMDEYVQLGHMEQIKGPVNDTIPHFYLPHHSVFKETSTTTKTRVVFDASCKSASGYSLNDTLMVGPVVQRDLLSIVMKFRIHHVVIVADIEKMYRQVLVHPDDQSFQRILWRSSPDHPISTYQLKTVTYGTSSAPYLATKTLQQLANDYGGSDFHAVRSLREDFYIDDLLTGAADVESAIKLRRELSAMLSSAGFPLKKWASNATEVLEDVPPEDLAILPYRSLQDEQAVSTLGLVWEPKSDTLRFNVRLPLPAAVLTKRMVMSYIARIFDPLGLVGPTISKAKLFMQRLWALKHNGQSWDWDTPLPLKLQEEWKQFHSTLNLLSEARIPRFVSMPDSVSIQLHFFSDASENAYGTCCYVRTETSDKISVQLLTSKSKVAPLSTRHSIARLELCGAHLSMLLFKKVNNALQTPSTVHFWTDSTTVLQWLHASPSRWKTFVSNRVSQIQLNTNVDCWKHVAGIDNPADDISRGLQPADIITRTRWWRGPPWLALPSDCWPITSFSKEETAGALSESRKSPLIAMTSVQSTFCNELFSRFSSFTKLRRVTAFCQRYIENLHSRYLAQRENSENLKPSNIVISTSVMPDPLNSSELRRAENFLCRLAQAEMFAEEISNLTSGERVAKNSPLKWLNPFIDRDNILRVGGRLSNAPLTTETKHPLVLSAKHPLSALLASHYHLKLLHAGPQLMLATLRQKYWILGGRNLVKSVFHHCHTCFKSKPTLVQQSTADLPASRVSPTRPFSVCGVDYCGPFFIKSPVKKRGPTKAYVAIFVCFSTKAVHIELVSDLSTPAFLAALRRLVARRGKISELNSDNATAFKGASNALHRIYRMLKVDEDERRLIFDWCADNEIRWKFIPPRAPHFGGLWEAAVKSAKLHMLKTIGNVNISYENMLTLLAQVEMCLNSRPLTPMPQDPSDLEVLTPGHFLIGENMQSVPEVDLTRTAENRLDHWELTQKRFQVIWSRWYPEYLQQLQSRATKGCNPPVRIEEGRIVIIKEDNVPSAKWPLGKITKLHPGKDGVVRVVTLRTASAKEVVRAVSKIALLPVLSQSSSIE